jgi:hypothetical protein
VWILVGLTSATALGGLLRIRQLTQLESPVP